ncbi:MAG: acryloyl-CoA reductase [Chloroflexi bacterium]|nr:acryloyl-CoA reductase [Chloroflexota bacterium]
MTPETVRPTFRAYVVEHAGERLDGPVTRGVREFAAADLPPGEVTIRVAWSSVNYKDGLAATSAGRVARISPLVPGIDLAGAVVASDDPAIHAGDAVVVHGHDLGVAQHGGFAEYARVPAAWIVPLPAALTARDAMAIGTAGFTAALSVQALESRGLTPAAGPVLVTGATGGVGSTAVAILADRGYEVWAVTGKEAARDWLAGLGAAGFLSRDEVAVEGRPLEHERWAGAIDSVGAAALPYILRTLRRGAAVAACGNASGPALATTVLPFILRGVALLGMDSAWLPIRERRDLWERLATDLRPSRLDQRATEVGLDTLEPALDGILAGAAEGRWIVRLGE